MFFIKSTFLSSSKDTDCDLEKLSESGSLIFHVFSSTDFKIRFTECTSQYIFG